MDVRLQQYGVTPAQARLLLYVFVHDEREVTQRDLEQFLQVRPSTVNGLVDRLEEKGLLTRTVSAVDGRRRILRLTPAGRVQQAQFESGIAETELLMKRGLSPEEGEQLRGLLHRVIQNLEEDVLSC